MSDAELMQACAEALIRDVTVTTGFRIQLSIWVDRDNGIGAVVHEAGIQPKNPVWEAVGWVGGGDCLAVHSPGRPTAAFPHNGNATDVTFDIANAVQQLVQVLLWQHGQDSTWPSCPEHHGHHPLRPTTSLWDAGRPFPPVDPEIGAALWACPEGTIAILIGELPSR